MKTHCDTKSFRVFLILFLTLLTAVLPSNTVYSEESGWPLNASGVPNRPLSIDPTGRTEGFSAVLYDNTNGLPTSEANAIAETSEGFLWIGSYAGLIRYDGNTFERMDSTGGLTSIKCLYVDSRDRLWIGTNDNGIAGMERGELRKWGKLDGLKSAHTRAITEDQDGTIYVATTCGIATVNAEGALRMMEDEAIADANMSDLRRGSDGIIYGLTNFGELMKIQNGALVNFLTIEETQVKGLGSILPDPENPGTLYFEGADFGFYHAAYGDSLTDFEKIDIQPLSYIQGMEYIDGKVWLCSSYGIGVLDEDGVHVLENMPMNNSVGHVMTDYLGNLWFTSTRQGVMKVVPNQFSNLFERFGIAYMTPDYQVTTIQKFPYTNNFDLYENSHGDMWVLSSNGIYVVPTEQLLANGEISPVYYGIASGLPCIATANSYSDLTQEGDLYIAGSTGVCKVNIEIPFEDVNDLKATVPYVEADGKVIYPDASGIFTIPADTQKLRVPSFVYNYSLNNPQVSRQLDGFEKESATLNRTDMVPVDYTNLRGGTYYYKMQLKDAMGRGNKIVSVQITKEKAFFEQTWFYIVTGLAAMLLLAVGVRLYIRKRMAKLEKQHKETMTFVQEITEAFAKVIDMKDKYTDVIFLSLNCRFIALNDGVDTLHRNNEMIAIFKNVMNDFARDTSSKIKAVKKSTFQVGKCIGA